MSTHGQSPESILRPLQSPAQNAAKALSFSLLAMTAEEVRQLDTEELCQWLKTVLVEDHWKDAEPVIREQMIEGKYFLVCLEDEWERFGLKWEVAYSLSRIAQRFLSAEAAVAREKEEGLSFDAPGIDLESIEDVRGFLTSHMRDPRKFHCMPHCLSATGRSFALRGRDKALKSAAEAFQVLSQPVGTTDRSQRKIPVCSGRSGLGKTRMLEEWERIFDLAEVPSPRLGVLINYSFGHRPERIERVMTIEASFSWRLLHRLFLEGNGPNFRSFMNKMLPKNARNLRLTTALEVVRAHLIASGVLLESECLHMFLGIDACQSIENVQGIRLSKVGGLLQDLLDSLGDVLSDPIHGIRLYPMFAGIKYSVMEIPNASKTETKRIPLEFLSAAEIEEAVGALTVGPRLLEHPLIRLHLLYFSGIPRWAQQYVQILLDRMKESGSSEVPSSTLLKGLIGRIIKITLVHIQKKYNIICRDLGFSFV